MKLFKRHDKLEGEVMPQEAYITFGGLFQCTFPGGRFDQPAPGKKLGWYCCLMTPTLGAREVFNPNSFDKALVPARFAVMVLVHKDYPNYWYQGWIRAD